MIDPILYLSIFLGLGGVYVLISSFHDDGHDDDGEKYIYNLDHTNLAIVVIFLKQKYLVESCLRKYRLPS